MSLEKGPKPRKKIDQNDQRLCHEAQNVGAKHKDNVEDIGVLHQAKRSPNSIDRKNNNTVKPAKKKEFVIPRKKKQAKELLQTHRFDSRETKELLRSVQLSLKDPNFWVKYKFERVEFVNNEKLARKYGEKKQALRLETQRTNRELEDKFAFLYTTSRTEAKSICEHGLRTGHSSLKSLGDPKLGVYLCRFADIIYKRPLTTDDSGYLLVFRVVKGKVRFIGGSNPELQPTPHHDCHMSKSQVTTLSSKTSHSDVFESSQFYFYEIDENSDDFHIKHPRQVLPYAVLTFTIVKSEQQQAKPEGKPKSKKAVVTGNDFPSSAEENNLSSPNRTESKDVISSAQVSWSGGLAINKKPFAYIELLSYSRKKHPLPIYMDHVNISQKISHDDLRSLLKCPVFKNGKPASSGVCIELGNGRKFIYYEVRAVSQVQEKFEDLISHFVDTKMAGVIEYFNGAVYLYLIPTSKLTHDVGITDRKSPLALHALVQVRHIRRLPDAQEPNEKTKEQDVGIDDTPLNEAVIRSQIQEIFKKKYDNKISHRKEKQKKIPSLMNERISLRDVEKGSDKLASRSKVRRNSSEVRLPLSHEGASHEERLKYQKDAQKLVDQFFNSVSKEKDSRKNTLRKKGTHPNTMDSDCSLSSQAVSSNNKDLNTCQIAKDEQTSRVELDAVNQNVTRNDEQGSPPTCVNSTTSFDFQSQNLKNSIDFLSVQKLIKEFQEYDKHGSGRSSGPVDPRLQIRSSSSQDVKHDKSSNGSSFVPPLSPPPLPPPPPPPITPFSISASSSTKENQSSLSGPSSTATDVPSMSLVTSPVSPPSVKRQEMTIPGLEPPGSPAFQLMREKVSFLNQSICTSATYLKDKIISTQSVTTWNERHPASPLMHSSSGQNTPLSTSESHSRSHLSLNDNKATSTRLSLATEKSPKAAVTSPSIDDNSHPSSKSAAHTSMLKLDIPDYSNVVITRPLTNAEKKSSQAIKKINNILFQNRDSLKNTPSEDENNTDFNHITDYKSQQPVGKLLLDQNNTNLTTPEKQSLQSESSYQSPNTPQLKNGLDLLDNLMSPSMSESHRQGNDARVSSEATKKSKDRSRETTPRKETCDVKKKKVSPSRKRKVTIKKNNNTVNESGWDDITSDISDTELPVDCNNTTDGYTKENHRKESMYRDQPSSPRSRENSRPSSRDGAETNLHYHDTCSKEQTSPRRKVSLEPVRDRSIDTQEVPVCRHTGRGNRNNPDGHPDDWDREWKRRKLDNDQEPLLPDDDSNYSDSPMSISPLNSPVSFEYAVPNDESYKNRYRFVRTSPEDGSSLKVTITRDIECNDNILSNVDGGDIAVKPYHSHEHPIIPSSPIEIDVPGNSATPYSPGTPETAVPGVDFLHASIGYWSSGVTTTKPVDRQSINILPQEIGDKKFQSTQQDNIQLDVTYRSERDPLWSTSSSPYCDDDDREDHVDRVISAQFQHEEPLVKKPRGEGYSRRGPSSFGESSGYDYKASSYNDRNLNNSSDYYTTVDHDGDPYGMSSHNELYTDQVYPDRYPQTFDDQRDRELYYTCRSPYENVDSPRSLESIDMEELGSGNRYYTSDQLEEYSMSERHGSPLQISDHSSYYSPDERGVIDDDFGRRITYSNDVTGRRGIITEDYGQRSPLAADDRPVYSPGRRGITDDNYGRRSPLTGDDRPLYSPGRRGITGNDYGRRSPLTNNEYRRRSVNDDDDRPSCSPSRRGITVNDYGGRSPSPSDERAQYSPGRLGIKDDDYGRRTSPSDDERAPYSPSRGGVNKDYGCSSPLEIQGRDSQYSPDRRPVTDNKYGEYYRISGGRNNTTRGSRICKYRQGLDDYQNLKQDFTLSIGDERDCHFVEYKQDIDIYQDEKCRNYSEDEDDVRDRQPCKYTIDTVEQNYDSEGDDAGCDSMSTPEHYDKEQHKYLDNIVENNISATTLELDRAVFDGIRNFPGQWMELASYLKNISTKANDEELACSDSSAANSSVSRDPRLNRDSRLHDSGFVSEETLTKPENAQRSVGCVGKEGESLEGAMQNGKVTSCKDDAERTVEDIKRRKKCGEHKKVLKQLPKKLSYFYVYNPDNDPKCEAVKYYMLKTGAHFLNVSDENNLKTMTGELRILVRHKHRPYIHRISNLDKLKLHGAVKFALFNNVDDVSKKTRAYAAIFQYGGVLIPDDIILRTVDPVYLEALLSFIAEQNSIHQKVFWVMNIRYIAYKKLGSQRPLTWRDAYVLDLLRKYRNEGFVNIINKDYVVENLSSVQKYLDTALKQQLDLMPTYRHFILLSDLNKQTLEVSWFLNRGIGFMNVKECLHMFAGEAKVQQLLSASKFTTDACDNTLEGTGQDIIQYDTIDSPEDEQSTTSVPSSTSPTTPTQTPSEILKSSHEGQCINNHFTRSLSCNMVSRSSNYKDDSSIKEKRLEILSSINNVKTNLMNNIQVKGNQGDVAKQRQYERSRSYEPRLRVHNERVTPRKPDDLRGQESTRYLEKNGLQGFNEAQYLKPPYCKGSSHHGNDRHYGYKETLSSTND